MIITSSDEMKTIMRRLKKIMALSTSSNPGEAAAALHQADVLMRKHGLSKSDVDMSTITELSFDLGTAQVARNDCVLCAIVKSALGVEVMTRGYKKKKGFKRPPAQIVFVGEACRVEIAKYAFFRLRRQLSKNMKTAFEELLVSAGQAKDALRMDAKRRDAYAQSWCAMVFHKVQLLAPKPSEHLAAYVAKCGAMVEPLNAPNSTDHADPISNFMAYQGVIDGRKIQLHQGVGSEVEPALAIAV